MKRSLEVQMIQLRGTYFEMGLKQGEYLLNSPLLNLLPQLLQFTNPDNVQKTKDILNRCSPWLLDEMAGLAEGLNLPLDTIIQVYSGYNVEFPSMGCTSLVNNGYYVRNYDYSPALYDARFVVSNPINGYASVGFSQQIIGRLDGMNEHGLVVGLHYVNSEHESEGFLATTIVRIVLEQCRNAQEAVQIIDSLPHGHCYNYSITDSSGDSILVEAAPHQQIARSAQSLMCTNHFESKALSNKNPIQINNSLKRKKYLGKLAVENLSPLSAYTHFNNAGSPLFYNNYKEFFGTLHTVVYSPQDLNIIVGIGENCQPLVFSLKEAIVESFKLHNFLKGMICQE